MKICWSCTQAIKDVDEFVSSSKQIWRNVTLQHLLNNESSAVNECRQNERQTADKNITIHPLQSINFKLSLLAKMRIHNP